MKYLVSSEATIEVASVVLLPRHEYDSYKLFLVVWMEKRSGDSKRRENMIGRTLFFIIAQGQLRQSINVFLTPDAMKPLWLALPSQRQMPSATRNESPRATRSRSS